jgi:ABC-type transporter Mla MlaB component
MFRISTHRAMDDATVISVAGALDLEATAELSKACDRELEQLQVVRLDLSDVVVASPSAVTLLIDLEARGVELANVPLLVRTQLENGQ